MKIFAFSGSLNPHDSTCEMAIRHFVSNLESFLTEEVELFFKKGIDLDIRFNLGTREEFTIGKQYIQDDMRMIEKEMLSSDMIILASPIYAHGISGYMKNFLDRISYWLHLIKLAGKSSVTICCTGSNGIQYGTDYLSRMLEHLGCSVLCNIEVKTEIQSQREIKQCIQEKAQKVAEIINKNEYLVSDFQEKKFITFKDYYLNLLNDDQTNNEAKYWEENGYFDYATYSDLYEAFTKTGRVTSIAGKKNE